MKPFTFNASKKLVLVAFALASFTSCNKDQKPAQTSATKTTAATDKEEKSSETTPNVSNEIVYINSDTLLTNYELYKEVRTRLEGRSQNLERDLRNKAAAFQKEVGQFQQAAQGMTEQQRAATEQRLGQKQQQLAAQQQNAGSQLANEENEETKKIYEKVEAYLKKLSAEKGYKMVLTYTRGNGAILYGDASLDITKEVLEGLNQEYKDSKAKK